jgi:endonuclease/exonuclease/phosphatase family metal-dependent hydrolase
MTRLRQVAVRIGLVLVLLLVGGTATLATAPPASAGVTAPSISLAFGDRSLTVAWGKVAGATGYHVQYSTSSSFSRPVTLDAGTRSWLFVKNLRNGTRYYARVVARAGTAKAVSRVLSAVPDDGYPRELRVTAVPAGPHAIRVSWTGQGRATKVGVLAGSEGSLTRHPFHTAWYPATTRSVVLTVPTSLREELGTGSGNPVFVKVAVYNSLTAGTAMPTVRNEAAAYRLSPGGTYAYAGTTTPTGAKLRVATLNVHSVAASASLRGQTWKDRRGRVAAEIAYSRASVVAAIEATTADAGLGTGARQWEDLRDLLAKPANGGYAIANSVTSATRNGAENTTVGAHLFYDPDVVTREAGGFVSPRDTLGIAWPSGLTDRYFSWARFRVKATGATFYAAAVHLPADAGTTSYAALRNREAVAIDRYVSGLAGGRPVLLMGDLNSSFAELPSGPEQQLRARGYYDASAAAVRANPRVSTANITRQVDNLAVRGYPTRPYVYQYPAPRIDYIMIKNSPGAWRYANQLVLVDGVFNRAYQGSDHNLQWAEVGIR